VKTHVSLRRARRELAQNYARLQALEQLRDDLVHMIVHDMRSPLTVLKWSLDFLELNTASLLTADAKHDVHEALRAVSVLSRMANELLDVSRLEEGKMPVERQACDLVALSEGVRASWLNVDRERTLELTAEGPVTVTCDKELVLRVLENLVSNAIKHTPRGGRIGIGVRIERGRARVTVDDDGPGIPAEARARIFEKFSVVEGRRKSPHHSAGLGLAFCKLAIEAHGGTIGVDAPTSGGSRFWFELPG
jgi:signal transduction histidine kinase